MKPRTTTDQGHAQTLVVGIGNPIMGDDGVGILVLRHLKEKISASADLEFKELSVGGIKLVEEILDYRTVFVIDSIEAATVGSVNEFSPEQLSNTYCESAPHAVNFITALELYRKLQPHRIPEKIRIFTIGINSQFVFTETLTTKIEATASRLTELLAGEIDRIRNLPC